MQNWNKVWGWECFEGFGDKIDRGPIEDLQRNEIKWNINLSLNFKFLVVDFRFCDNIYFIKNISTSNETINKYLTSSAHWTIPKKSRQRDYRMWKAGITVLSVW